MFSKKTPRQPFSIQQDILKFEDSPFLFLCQTDVAQRQYQHFKGEILLSEEMISKFQENIQFNREYTSSVEVPYHHVVFPAKIPIQKSLR